MRIHLLCDHKWRDLPNLSLLQVELQHLGHKVLLSSTKDAQPMIGAFRPDCVVLNHLLSSEHRSLAKVLRAAGIAVIILPTEGAVRPEFAPLAAGAFSDYSLADMILAWSLPAAEDIRSRWNMGSERVPVVGCTRFDFYNEQFSHLVDTREYFCREYDLDPNRPIVTWATQFGYAYLANSAYKAEKEKWKREIEEFGVAAGYKSIGINPEDVPRLTAEAREKAANAFFKLCQALPNVQFLIKPHPTEDLSFYQNMLTKYVCKNIRFCPGTYIWNVLNSTDIELHRQCTTAVEAWMWDKPTIEMSMDFVPQWVWKEREDGSDNAADAEQLIDLVRSYLNSNTRGVPINLKNHRRDYIAKWFGPTDGNRCAFAATIIDEYLRARGSYRRYFSPIKGLKANLINSTRAIVNWQLNNPPNQPLFYKSNDGINSITHDKLIVRSDVVAYKKKIFASPKGG